MSRYNVTAIERRFSTALFAACEAVRRRGKAGMRALRLFSGCLYIRHGEEMSPRVMRQLLWLIFAYRWHGDMSLSPQNTCCRRFTEPLAFRLIIIHG